MRAKRCPGCGDRFYVNPNAPAAECQNCSGDYDPSAQAKQDADNIARVNDSRVFGGRKQTMDLRTLQEAQKAQEAPTSPARGKKANG